MRYCLSKMRSTLEVSKWLQIKSADGSNEIVCQIRFIVESADGLTMNFMKVLSRLQVLRRGASRSYTFSLLSTSLGPV